MLFFLSLLSFNHGLRTPSPDCPNHNVYVCVSRCEPNSYFPGFNDLYDLKLESDDLSSTEGIKEVS